MDNTSLTNRPASPRRRAPAHRAFPETQSTQIVMENLQLDTVQDTLPTIPDEKEENDNVGTPSKIPSADLSKQPSQIYETPKKSSSSDLSKLPSASTSSSSDLSKSSSASTSSKSFSLPTALKSQSSTLPKPQLSISKSTNITSDSFKPITSSSPLPKIKEKEISKSSASHSSNPSSTPSSISSPITSSSTIETRRIDSIQFKKPPLPKGPPPISPRKEQSGLRKDLPFTSPISPRLIKVASGDRCPSPKMLSKPSAALNLGIGLPMAIPLPGIAKTFPAKWNVVPHQAVPKSAVKPPLPKGPPPRGKIAWPKASAPKPAEVQQRVKNRKGFFYAKPQLRLNPNINPNESVSGFISIPPERPAFEQFKQPPLPKGPPPIHAVTEVSSSPPSNTLLPKKPPLPRVESQKHLLSHSKEEKVEEKESQSGLGHERTQSVPLPTAHIRHDRSYPKEPPPRGTADLEHILLHLPALQNILLSTLEKIEDRSEADALTPYITSVFTHSLDGIIFPNDNSARRNESTVTDFRIDTIKFIHSLRAVHHCICISVDLLMNHNEENPSCFNTDLVEGIHSKPRIIVIDHSLICPQSHPLLRNDIRPIIICTSTGLEDDTEKINRKKLLEELGAEIIPIKISSDDEDDIDYKEMLLTLGSRFDSILIEGGASLFSSMIFGNQNVISYDKQVESLISQCILVTTPIIVGRRLGPTIEWEQLGQSSSHAVPILSAIGYSQSVNDVILQADFKLPS